MHARPASLALAMFALVGGLALPTLAAADEPTVLAIQQRKHRMRHEYTAWVGVLPLDAFTKGLTFSGAYTLHFNDLVAWQIGQFTYSVGIDTRLADELAALAQPIGPTPFETVDYYATSSFVFKPLYGKMAALNRTVIHQELLLQVGAGVGWMTLSTRPVLEAGFAYRLFLDRNTSVRLDLRDAIFFASGDPHNELWLGLGLSVGFGRNDK
ncbi:MAG: outer membrane beta-barrel domain-containing protein [Myxococcota bacterium]